VVLCTAVAAGIMDRVANNNVIGGRVQQADAADEPHGGWKVSKVASLHLKSGSQLIRGVGRTVRRDR